MSDPDPIAAGLDRRYERCCQIRRAQQTEQRWQRHSALAGCGIAEIRHILSTPTIEQNPPLAALLRAHQGGDVDATTVLLAAFIPYVCSDPAITVTPERIADRWAALAHLLATVDPDEAVRLGESRPFLRVLVGRMRRRAAHLRFGPERHADPVTGDVIELYGRRTSSAVVEDQALARVDLAVIAGHLQTGAIPSDRWRRLVDDRLHGQPNRAGRGSIRHTARRLAVLTGRVA